MSLSVTFYFFFERIGKAEANTHQPLEKP